MVAEVGTKALACDPEMRALRTANKRLAQELEVSKSYRPQTLYARYLGYPADAMSCYRFIAAEQPHHQVQLLCRVLGVVLRCYYAWYQRQAAPLPAVVTCFKEAVKEVFYDHHRRHGTRRLRVEFQAQDHRVGRQCLRTVMRRLGLRMSAKRIRGSCEMRARSGRRVVGPNAQLMPKPKAAGPASKLKNSPPIHSPILPT